MTRHLFGAGVHFPAKAVQRPVIGIVVTDELRYRRDGCVQTSKKEDLIRVEPTTRIFILEGVLELAEIVRDR